MAVLGRKTPMVSGLLGGSVVGVAVLVMLGIIVAVAALVGVNVGAMTVWVRMADVLVV